MAGFVLPEEFKNKIISLIGKEEFVFYEEELSKPRTFGLRANKLKTDREELRDRLKGIVEIGEDVPWSSDGLYFEPGAGSMPGRISYYLAGLYYIQEPSAMYPAEVLGAKPGEKVLDLCAAPGGKSTKIAGDMKGEGILFTNDISAPRANTLLYNLELSGVENAITLNESPESLAKRFPHYFDRILVDAPCSGEGMFRKDDEAVSSWGNFKNETCVSMQREILEYVDAMLKPGGTFVYSTCTFDKRENEGMISEFMSKHPDYELCELPKPGGISDGFDGFEKTARLWPHRLKGEGHFTAKLIKKGEPEETAQNSIKSKSYRNLKEIPPEFAAFCRKYMTEELKDKYFYMMGDQLFYTPFEPLPIDGLKVLRMGIHAGEITYGKFRPSQSFVMSVPCDAFRNNIDFDFDSDSVKRFVRGESLNVPEAKDGINAVRVRFGDKAFILGLGDVKSGMLKNLYPKGWRRML